MSVPASLTDRPEEITQASGSTFLWPMLLLPPAKRRAMYALYAFCRQVDDIVDLPGEPDVKRRRLADWRTRVRGLYAGGVAGDPVASALARAIQRYHLPRGELEAVIDGVTMDLVGMRAPALDELRVYCRRVAGAVGLLAIRIFDRADEETEAFALALGDALQLTNILRDLLPDSTVDRLYVPREYLVRAGILDTDPKSVLTRPGFGKACTLLADEAERRFADAEDLLRRWPSRRLWSARAMMVLYRRLLVRLRHRGWEELDTVPRAGSFEAAAVTLRCLLGRPPPA